MLKLDSKEIMKSISGSALEPSTARSTTSIAVSSAIGVGLLYVGVTKGHKNPWWHLATIAGGVNLFGNGRSLLKKA